MILKTDYTNRIVSGSKKYQLHNNGDGTYCIEDKSIYAYEGDYYGAADLNKQNYVYNTLVDDYSLVDDLITKLTSYGITLSDNSPTSILNAINTIASNSFDTGRTSGQNAVKADPNSYNLYSKAQYDEMANASTNYTAKANASITSLTSWKDYIDNWYGLNVSGVTKKYNETVDYINSDVEANMSGGDAKTVRNNVKDCYSQQNTAFITGLNNLCGGIDSNLNNLSV